MPQRTSSRHRSTFDFAALVAVLATGVLLVALGVAPESLAAVTIALSGLYSTWRVGSGGQGSGPQRQPGEEHGSRALDTEPVSAPREQDHSHYAP
jgi:hypothetical protein